MRVLMKEGSKRRVLLALLLLLVSIQPLPAQKRRRAAPPPRDLLKERIEAVLAERDAWRAHWGIKIVSLETGRVLFSRNEHQYFTPASNTKLFTMAAVLEVLGPQFKFRTTVESAAPPDKLGRIAGDLHLVGRGDPNLSSRILPYRGKPERSGAPLRALDLLAEQVAGSGVRYVDGDVVGDDTYFVFERYGEGWSQDDLVWSYGAPVSALSVNDNVVFLEVLPGEKPGDRALVKWDPYENYYQVENRILTVEPRAHRATSGGGDEENNTRRIFVNREPGSRALELWGRIPVGDAGWHDALAMEDPAFFAAQYFREALQSRGVVVYGQARVRHARPIEFPDLRRPPPAPEVSETGARAGQQHPGWQTPFAATPARNAGSQPPAPNQVLATLESLPLVEDLKVISKVSQNLHAEMVLRTLARERRGIGSVAAGLEELQAFLTHAGIPPEEYVFFDGSGLSRQNLVSPAAVTQLLSYMYGTPHRDAWMDLLPVAGVDGTLAERFKDTPAEGNLRGKTGTLSHVSALAGYATTAKGERVTFAIFVNNHNARGRATRLLDKLALALVESR